MDCPVCGGQGESMGVLGNLLWLSCRQCGMQFSHTLNDDDLNMIAMLDDDYDNANDFLFVNEEV